MSYNLLAINNNEIFHEWYCQSEMIEQNMRKTFKSCEEVARKIQLF